MPRTRTCSVIMMPTNCQRVRRWLRLFFTLSLSCQLIDGLSLVKFPRRNGSQGCQEATSDFKDTSRRSLLFSVLSIVPLPAFAAVTDETDSFGDNWWTSSQAKSQLKTSDSQTTEPKGDQAQTASSDEVVIYVSKKDIKEQGGLGLELAEIEFRTNLRVYVKSIKPSSLGSRLGIQKDFVIVSVNGQSTERTNAGGVAQILSKAINNTADGDSIPLTFRDPSVFRQRLENLSPGQPSVTTQVAPAGDTTQRNRDGSVRAGYSVTEQTNQKVTVTQLVPPLKCTKGAATGTLIYFVKLIRSAFLPISHHLFQWNV